MPRSRLLALILATTFCLAGSAGGDDPAPAREAAPPEVAPADQPGPAPGGGDEPTSERVPEQTGQQGPRKVDWTIPALLLGAMALIFFFSGRSRRKREASRRRMLAELAKGDKVTTIGGVVGTVMDIREDEVTVKVDESSNTRMRFARWAIRGIGADATKEKPEDKR